MGKWFQDKSFSTEKRGQGIKIRKAHRGANAWKVHHALGILLAAALVFQTVPFNGIAVSASERNGGGLCEHHRSHTPDCGYQSVSGNGEGSSCTYDCCICPVEELIAALPDAADITEDNAEEVRAQLDEILALYRELTEDEQEQIDLSRCYALQEALDAAKAPVMAEEIPADAVAKIEKEGAETAYVTADKLDDVFSNSSYAGAIITLLANVERTSTLYIRISCTLDLSGHTITCSGDCISVYDANANVTIRGEGKVISEENNALTMIGSVTLEGGTFIGNGENNCGVYVAASNVALSVTGENVVIQNTKGYGLGIYEAQSVQLSSGKYSGAKGAIVISNSLTLGDLLDHTGDTWYAYFKDTSTTPLTGVLSDKSLTGTVRVQPCDHSTVTAVDNSNGTHSIPACPACGLAGVEDQAHDWTETAPCTVCGAVAVAKVEKDSATTLVDKTAFLNAFKDGTNNGVTITMLHNVELTKDESITLDYSCTLDLNGHTISQPDITPSTFSVLSGTVTIKDSGTGGEIRSGNTAIGVGSKTGTVSIESGTVLGSYIGVRVTVGSANISGTAVISGGNNSGLLVERNGTAVLSGGTFTGRMAIIVNDNASVSLKDMLATGYAYHQNDIPVVKAEGLVGDYEAGEVPLDATPAWLSGTVTVKECQHNGEGVCTYTHTSGTTTHQKTCLACGNKCDEENCSFGENGKCACEAVLAVALKDNTELTYTGEAQTPEVNVTVDGIALAAEKYQLSYDNNINAGNTAKVTVSGKSFTGTVTKTFTIEKAEQTDLAFAAVTKPYEKNGTFTLAAAGGAGSGAVLYRVPENNGVLMVNGDQATIIGVGTVTVTATKAESENYKAATATGTVTITKATAPAITYPTAGSITYGQKLSDSALTGGSTEYGTFAWENGSTVPTVGNTGYTVVFTPSEETKKNYETITDTTRNVPVKVEKAVPAVSITAAVSGSQDNRQAVLTVNVAKAGAGAFPTGTVTFIDCPGSTEVKIGTATLSDGAASYTWDGLLDKAYTIKAVYAGDGNYKEAGSRELAFDTAKQNQQDLSLDAIGAKTYGDAAFSLRTTGGSGNGAVRYESSDENVIRIENGKAVIAGAGTATITAIKAGDDDYNEASAGRTVTVAKKALTVRADSKSVVRGNAMPAFTYRAEGLVNGDTFTTAPSMTADVQNTDTLGKYDIVIGGGTLQNSESYHITYVNGTLHIVERFYTVTVTDGTGGGEYAEGDTVTVTANDKSGYTFTGWSSEDGVAFADSRAKTTTFTMPARSVTVKANYTRNSSGNTGGNAGGSGNNGGGNAGGEGNINPGSGAAPGTTPINPGIGNTVRPGIGSGNGAGTPAQGTKQPFIKGADGKTGWDAIRAEEEKAQEGSTINVDMNGSTVVPGDIFDSIRGKDITVTFDMGGGILWSVDGKSITRDASLDKAGDIDFSVKKGVNTVPVDIVNHVTGENYSIQISLAHEGEFGFTAVLSIVLGQENAGYRASLYYYNESTGELEFICSDEVAQDGTVSLAFTHASDYVIAIDAGQEEDSAAEPAQPEGTGEAEGSQAAQGSGTPESPGTVQTGKPWWIMVILLSAAAAGAGVFVAVKKKGKDENGRQ